MARFPVISFSIAASLLLIGHAAANEVASDTSSEASDAAEEVLVTGVQPGPALWRVSSGDHVLWILGEVSPLPSKVEWRSRQFERVLAGSREVLLEQNTNSERPNTLQAAEAHRAQKLPKGTTLQDVVSPELYARVEVSKRKFRGTGDMENLRPFEAARRIVNSAIRSLDLKAYSAKLSVAELARKADVSVTTITTPPQSFDDYLRSIESDSTVGCLERVVAITEDGGVGLRQLANAWSIGDIDALRRLVPQFDALTEGHAAGGCDVAVYGSIERANEQIAKRTALWMNEAERVLRDNASTIAVVPMAELLDSDGYLARLRAKGYEVVEPE